eukprot:TRINITY_DN10546_c0_g1_i1.p1 TRINITY_DN10546_c0_g1~~TRINITY_DN10546_c0_g1_i1.p1  ORF type:complete len:123 (+),score=11.05 TRINITY_DN10546_c0_g1_i1:132-500(+)
MIRRPPRPALSSSSAASDVYKRQVGKLGILLTIVRGSCASTTQAVNIICWQSSRVVHLIEYDGRDMCVCVCDCDCKQKGEVCWVVGSVGTIRDDYATSVMFRYSEGLESSEALSFFFLAAWR